jgi:hypothetical protein
MAFLGLVERAAYDVDEHGRVWKQHLLGLHNSIVSPVYPQSTDGLAFAFAIYNSLDGFTARLSLVDEDNVEAGYVDIDTRSGAAGGESPASNSPQRRQPVVMPAPTDGWAVFVIPSGHIVFTIPKPGEYRLLLKAEEGEAVGTGHLSFGLAEPVPLTADRIAAIRSDPLAAQAVQATLGCGECENGIWFYTALERDLVLESKGCIWHADLPDSFACRCGLLELDLSQYRRNLPGLLGTPTSISPTLAFVPLYEASSLHRIASSFAKLIAEETREEALQKFIEANPLLLHPFSPERVFFKAPILTQFHTDFTIVNHKQELIFIELEKPGTKLLKKDGGIHSELQHAFDQVRDWLHTTEEHRAAVLDCIHVDRTQVGAIRGVVIAGRDTPYPPEHLRKLKGQDLGRISFMTYDDLLASISTLSRTFEDL